MIIVPSPGFFSPNNPLPKNDFPAPVGPNIMILGTRFELITVGRLELCVVVELQWLEVSICLFAQVSAISKNHKIEMHFSKLIRFNHYLFMATSILRTEVRYNFGDKFAI